jgi:hypothetical protein
MDSPVVDRRSYHLFPKGLLVFERALGPGGPSRVFVSRATVCPELDCDCREVTLTGVGIDLAVGARDFGIDSKQIAARIDGPEAMSARLHIDLGVVQAADTDGQVPLTAEWVAYLQSQVDGDLLDRLHDDWLRAKGIRPKPRDEVTWPAVEPGQGLVGWYEIHPGDRRDSYLLDGVIFIAEELYCINPTCTCSEAVIDFAELTDDNRTLGFGHFRVSVPDLQVTEWKSKRESQRPLLEKLWTTFQARHRRVGERLAERKRHITELGARHAATRVPIIAPQRAGRNDPCPCGSGKKYKRCCAP